MNMQKIRNLGEALQCSVNMTEVAKAVTPQSKNEQFVTCSETLGLNF
jgi:hypothetical protein